MMVKILLVDQDTGDEKLQGVSELRDCFPEDEEGYRTAADEIAKAGRTWVGGGAAPLFLLKA
jgi:hypothetical protein